MEPNDDLFSANDMAAGQPVTALLNRKGDKDYFRFPRGGAKGEVFRVEYAGKVIAFSGDTEWTDTLVEASRDADLFICECNSFDSKAPGHLDYETLAANRARLQSKRTVITHMSAEMLAHLNEVEFEAAHDGAVIEL